MHGIYDAYFFHQKGRLYKENKSRLKGLCDSDFLVQVFGQNCTKIMTK